MSLNRAVHVIIAIIVAAAVFWLLWLLVDFIGFPPPFGHILKVIIAIVAVLVAIGFLLRVGGWVNDDGKPLV